VGIDEYFDEDEYFFFSHLVIFGRKGREGEGEAVEGS
jgi:hypothetical protein